MLLRQGYAAHGGVSVVMCLAWSWLMGKCPPDLYDVLGGLVVVAGVETIMHWPRGRLKEELAGQSKQFET
jgi:small multidrug resistance family-3 protein